MLQTERERTAAMLCDNIKTRREALGFNSPQSIYKWQSGLALPGTDNLVVLAAVLQVSVDEILVVNKS